MIKRLILAVLFLFMFSALALLQANTAYPETGVSLGRVSFEAHGRNETEVSIPGPGRYAFRASSKQGTSIALVDMMAGEFAVDGFPGVRDGRVDAVLDKGRYKIRLVSHERGEGALSLEAVPFRELGGGDLPLLGENEVYSSELRDLEQLSYWIDIGERRTLRLEAIGRGLDTCLLWLKGGWLSDTKPMVSEYSPVPGRPMTYVEYSAETEPGTYLVTCYGGEVRKWADDSEKSPFHIRLSVPALPENGKEVFNVSPFGRDSFILPKETDFVQIMRDDKKDTALRVSQTDDGGTRHGGYLSASIDKESRNPWCSVSPGKESGKIATVEAEPGARISMVHFSRRTSFTLEKGVSGYWISGLHSFEGADSIDATAIIADYYQNTPVDAQTPVLGPNRPIGRRVNLLGRETFFVFVETSGDYVVEEARDSGAEGTYLIEPFMTSRPNNYIPPPQVRAGGEVELTRGYHVITIWPVSKGILSFAIRAKGDFFSGLIKEAKKIVGRDEGARPAEPRKGIFFPNVRTKYDRTYTVYLNARHDVSTGVTVRALPMDLTDPLPVELGPGEEAPLDVIVKEPSRLAVRAAGDSRHSANYNGKEFGPQVTIQPGRHVINIKNEGGSPAFFEVSTAAAKERGVVLIPVADFLHDDRPFRPLSAGETVFEDYERGQERNFLLKVEEPGLYRVETSGLLATGISIRGRTTPSIASARTNGVGRNALVMGFLKPGEYMVAVWAEGRSAGRAGVRLSRTRMIYDERRLVPDGAPLAASLSAGSAVRYAFGIKEQGRYLLRSSGLGKVFDWRVEDGGGWPLSGGISRGDLAREFQPGDYYYYSLPSDVESMRITSLERIPEKRVFEGKGPHIISLDETVNNMWREEPGRPPDVYMIEIPAPVPASTTLPPDMEAELVMQGADTAVKIPGGRRWEGELRPGAYEIRVRSRAVNNLLPYSFSVHTDYLVPGTRKTVSALPGSIKVSLGQDAIVDVRSSGPTDVKASLVRTSTGEVVAENDDTPEGWNFRISGPLKKGGDYEMRVSPVGTVYGPVAVSMRVVGEKKLGERKFPFAMSETLSGGALSGYFRTGGRDGLVHLSAKSGEAVRFAVSRDGARIAEGGVGDLYIPLKGDTVYGFSLWADDAGTAMVEFSAEEVPAKRAKTGGEKTLRLNNADAVEISTEASAAFTLGGEVEGLCFSPGIEMPCVGTEGYPMTSADGRLWLVPGGRKADIKVEPFFISAGEEKKMLLRGYPITAGLRKGSRDRALIVVKSTGRTVGAAVSEDMTSKAAPGGGLWKGFHVGQATTGALFYEGKKAFLKIWLADNSSRGEVVTISSVAFPDAQVIDAPARGGLPYEGAIGPESASLFKLAGGAYDLMLSRCLAAFRVEDGFAAEAFSGEDDNLSATIRSDNGVLAVFNPCGEEGYVGLGVLPPGRAVPEVVDLDKTPDFERVFGSGGRLVFAVERMKPGTVLYTAGDSVKSRFFDDDGRATEAGEYPDATGGLLEVTYGPGLVKVWTALAGKRVESLIGETPQLSKNLDDIVRLSDSGERWDLPLAEPCYLTIRTVSPGITAVLRDGRVEAYDIGSGARGRAVSLYATAGRYTVVTRPVGGLAQRGEMFTRRIKPADISDAVGANRLIWPGDTHVYSFRVETGSTVGVGVWSEKEKLEASLIDENSRLLSRGPMSVLELGPAAYVLAVETLPDATAPVLYRPLVLGNKGSLAGVPEETVRIYMERQFRMQETGGPYDEE